MLPVFTPAFNHAVIPVVSVLCLFLCLILPLLHFLRRYLYHPSTRERPFRPTAVLPIECWDLILDQCSIQDIISFARTSTACRQYAFPYLSQRVRNALSPWFKDPLAFRHQLKRHNAIVSGSFVLALATTPSWIPGDLDLYVGSADGFEALCQYCESEGFEDVTPPPPLAYVSDDPDEIPNTPSHFHPYMQIRTYRLFVKTVRVGYRLTEVYIDLIQTESRIPALIVREFPLSCVMNWLTANDIVITYPRLTSSNIALLRPHGRKPPTGTLKIKEDVWLNKYIDRGFRFVESSNIDVALPQTCGESCPFLMRNSHDAACLRVTYGSEQWTGNHQDDPLLAWPDNAYLPAYPNCRHPNCPRRTSIASRIKSMVLAGLQAQ
ncbi:hypothetical protein FRC04_003476 [Tulasnella sp. 424]|nr:hypothetical protein FRC04_003476 [Tulasnella sp. 424]KAG8965739.1 hypothetical protein FRC05_003056 [Tulasnella sp. 425]